MPGLTLGRRAMLAMATLPSGLAGLSSCQMPATPPAEITVGPSHIGYILLSAVINDSTVTIFKTITARMVALGATEIHLAINSPGGVIPAAEAIIAHMDQTSATGGVRYVTHNVGVVASAACYVFLAGQSRLSIQRGAFLFHEAAVQTNGPLTSEALDRATAEIKKEERTFLAMLKARTRLSDGEALSFVRRTVLLSANEAVRDGVIEGIAPYVVPPGTTVSFIVTKPGTATPRPPTPA